MSSCRVALSCNHCNVINQMLKIRSIGYRSTVALSSPMLQIIADVQHHYQSDTNSGMSTSRLSTAGDNYRFSDPSHVPSCLTSLLPCPFSSFDFLRRETISWLISLSPDPFQGGGFRTSASDSVSGQHESYSGVRG